MVGSSAKTTAIAQPEGRAVFLETFGCQMNELDSELVRGHLSAIGYRFIDDPKQADVILYNTCSVREQAENKALSRVGVVGKRKEAGRSVILGVIGCLAEREGAGLMKKYPQIDLMCGPGELDKLPLLLDNAMKTAEVDLADRIALQGSNSRRSTTLAAAEDNLEMLDLSRAFDPDRAEAEGRLRTSAYVRITRGCNKFCTYCVVPNTRGPEVHRPPDSIVEECRKLAEAGVIEITLLGQTVNHYRYTHGAALTVGGSEAPQVGPGAAVFKSNGIGSRSGHAGNLSLRGGDGGGGGRVTTFADLLKRIHDEVPAIQRLRFVTSFPRDFGDDILQVMADSPRICRYLHVPAQSGSNRMLKAMNRGYTRAEYLAFIERARAFLPDVCIAGDFIVGFCGETEDDFEQTKSLMREVRFKNNFIFKYSPRPGTTAFDRMADDVPEDVKRRRNNALLDLQAEISASVHAGWIGRTVDVFIESARLKPVRKSADRGGGGVTGGGAVEIRWAPRKGDDDVANTAETVTQLSGRTPGDLITVFDLPAGTNSSDFLGRIIPVRITAARPLLLEGEVRGTLHDAAAGPVAVGAIAASA